MMTGDRGYKRPRIIDRPSPARPRSPERVPPQKRARREDDDHPANKLPPALRGRVKLPGEHRDRGDAPPAVAADATGQADRQHDYMNKQHSSKGRGPEREEQLSRHRQAQAGTPTDRGPLTGHRGPRPELVERSQGSRYDMSSSDHRSSRGGGVRGRGTGRSSSRRPRSPTWSDRLHTSPGGVAAVASPSQIRARPSEGRNSRGPDGSRGDECRGERSSKRNAATGQQNGRRGGRSHDREGEQRSSAPSPERQLAGGDRQRHAVGAAHKRCDQACHQSQPEPAAVDAAVKQQPLSPCNSSLAREEGEALPTPTAAGAERIDSHHEEVQQQGVVEVVSPASGGAQVDGSVRNSHQPIKFTLQKLPSVTTEDLKPKHSSKYSSPPETHQGPQQQQQPKPQQQQQQQQQVLQHVLQSSRPPSAEYSHRDTCDTLGANSRHTAHEKPDHSNQQGSQSQHCRKRDEVIKQQEEASISRREPSREVSEDISRDHTVTAHSRLQRVRDSNRPALSSHSGHKATITPREWKTKPVEVPSTNIAASSDRTADEKHTQQQQPEQRSTIQVTLGAHMSWAAIGYVVPPGVLSGLSAMCAEGQARTAAVHDRQQGLVALQLQGLPISRQLCFTETWQELVQVTGARSDAFDSASAELDHRATAAMAASSRACRHLLPPLHPLRPLTAGTSEEQHLRHLQVVINSYTEDDSAANCVHLADGGSMLLPPTLKEVLW